MEKGRCWLFLSLFLVLSLFLTGVGSAMGPEPAAPQDALEQAWERAREAGSYRYVSTAEQTMIPLPLPDMIGQGDVHLTLENDGAVLLPERAYIELRVAGAGQQKTVTLLRDGDQAFMLQDGQVKPVDDALSLAAPNNDILGYLAAAEQVTLMSSPEGHPELTRYGFQLSGERFEEYMRRQAEKSLAADPAAPDGLKIEASPALQAIRGHGELWVNENGLPVRQVLDFEMPEASARYSARVHLSVDLMGYGQMQSLPRAVQGADGTWRLDGDLPLIGGQRAKTESVLPAVSPSVSAPVADPQQVAQAAQAAPVVTTEPAASWTARLLALLPVRIAPLNVALFLLAVLAIVAWRFFRRAARRHSPRRGYAILAIVMVPILIFSTPLQSGQYVRFMDSRAQAAEARAAGTPELLQALGFDVQDAPAADESGTKGTATAHVKATTPSRLTGAELPVRTPQALSNPVSLQSAATGSDALKRCGEGDLGTDTDGDGLPDPVELCLGTSPYTEDSDSDSIPDKVELDGFDWNSQHWDSDPLNPDSNGDKLLDTFEWSSTLNANGQAASPDLDDDGIPNIWDDDDDGDDVPDNVDLSPQGRSEYTGSFSLTTEGDALDGYAYIEVQVQPQDLAHLRYSTTALDWPMDDAGNIQDLDLSTEDIRMSPFLLIDTDLRPDNSLAEKYGFSSWEKDGGGYIVLSPLLPLEDGGSVYAFYGKVGYAPGQVLDMRWDAKMVWMTQMQHDQWVLHTHGAYGGYELETEMRLLHQFKEDFRLVGLHMTVNEGYEAAVMGTPAERDDLDLFRLQLGLSDTFKANVALEDQEPGETALQEIAQRFAVGSTASITHTFGVDPNQVGMSGPEQYLHPDAGMSAVGSELVPDFLETYDAFYGNARCEDADGNAVNCASLLVLYEQSTGGYDLNQMPTVDVGVADLDSLHINLADVPIVTTRGLQMRMYEDGPDGWQMATTARVLELVEARYSDDYETALRDLYPDLTTDDVRFIAYTAYLAALSPSYTAISVDGQALVPALADETALALNRALSEELEGEVETAIEFVGLGSGLAQALLGTASTFIWVMGDLVSMLDDWAKSSNLKNAWTGLGAGLFAAATAASVVMGAINAVCSAGIDLAMCRNEDALFAANLAVNSLSILAQAQCVASLVLSYIKGALTAISTAALVAQAIGMVVGIGVSWVCFGFAVATSGGDPVVWRVALAEAIVTTIYLVVVFALNFIPIIGQIITAILSLIDMIIGLFTGLFTDETWSIAKAVLNLFYDASTSTMLAEAEFGSFETGLQDLELGLVSGNRFEVSIPFSGVITKTDDGTNGDLEESFVEGQIDASATSTFHVQDMSDLRDCDIVNDEMHCSNTPALGFALRTQINGVVGFTTSILYQTVWAEYGMYHAWRWSTNTEQGTLPEDEQDPNELVLDVIPDSLDSMWNWSALVNPDHDGDGLTDDMETALGTNPDQPDTDHDGLSDYYEWQTFDELGADPLLTDTDGDGLNDGLERRIGSKVDVADSDGDGLTDGEEVRRVEEGVVVGGWQVHLAGYGDAWVTSSPMKADDDGDGLNAFEERAHSLSPQAVNGRVPTIAMSVEPIHGLPGGRSGVYLRPGDYVTITVQVASVGMEPVTSTMTLDLPYWMEYISGGALEGDRTPPMVRNGSDFSWDFTDAYELESYEMATTTIKMRVASFIMSDVSEIVFELPYADMTLHRSQQAVVDILPPDVAILAPTNGAFLRGGSYVVGGAASDAATWVTDVELSIVPQGSPADLQPVAGTLSPFAYTWSLPGDGVYSLQARAVDAMDNERTTVPVTVTVDNTAPSVTLSSEMNAGAVELSGDATDNLAGIERVQLTVDGQPWRSVNLTGAGTTAATWDYTWTVGVNAQGKHTVSVRTLDRAGNASDILTEEITVDRVAPASSVNSGAEQDAPPAVKANTPFTLTGVADEGGHLPLPALPADLRTGMNVLDDASVWLGLSNVQENDGGVSATWIGDMDADRLADLAVGLPGETGNAGSVMVIYGRAGGWPAAPELEMLAKARTRFYGVAGAGLGRYVASAGDVNSDAMFDLLIGERSSNHAYLVFGSPGPMGGQTLDGGRAGLHTLLTAPATVESLAGAGDVDGDGYDDILIRAGGTAYLVPGHLGPWLAELNVADEALASWASVSGALGVGDVNDDQQAEWVTMSNGHVTLYRWDASGGSAVTVATFTTADASPRVAALGDVDDDGLADWLYSDGSTPKLVYGAGATTHTFTGYDGLLAAPGDVDGDGRADMLLADAAGAASLIRQQAGGSPEVFATITGVGGAANAPYAVGSDLNSDGSAEVLLIPSRAAAEARGFDAPSFVLGFISPADLPQGASTGGSQAQSALAGSIQSTGADTRYVDDDSVCDGHTPCYTTIQAAVNASDGGGDTIIVYPGAYAGFRVPAGANYDNLKVQGVDPDAVFVEDNPGASQVDAIRVAADGVRLSNLTVRGATAGVFLEDGGGLATVAGGSETFIDRLAIHSVQHPISMSQNSALTLSDSTLAGDGTHAILYVDPTATTGIHTWNNDRAMPLPVVATMQPITGNGALLSAAGNLYAVSGGRNRQVYAATPGTGGALGDWSAPFSLARDFWYDTPGYTDNHYEGKTLLASSSSALYQLQTHVNWPKLGGDTMVYSLTELVNAVAVHPVTGDVYIGGAFTQIGGVDAFRLARWDGTSWHKVGGAELLDNGVDGPVYALDFTPAVDAGGNLIAGQWNLVIGGDFDHYGNSQWVGNVVMWTGSAWEVLGEPGRETTTMPDGSIDYGTMFNGTDGPVHALAHTSDGYIILGGSFTEGRDGYSGLLRNNIIAYRLGNPVPWYDMGWNLNGPVHSLAYSGGSFYGSGILYAGGTFTQRDSSLSDPVVLMSHVGRYNPYSDWQALGAGLTGDVQDLARDPVTGYVYSVSYSGEAVQRWDGSTWAQVSGPSWDGDRPYSVIADADGNVYVGADGNGAVLYVQRPGTTGLVVVGAEWAGKTMSADWIADLALDASGQVYAATDHWVNYGGGYPSESYGGLSRWSISGLYKRNVPTGSWARKAYPPTASGWDAPTAIASDESGNLYAVWGSYGTGVLYSYDATANTWTQRANPSASFYLKHLVWADGMLYAAGHVSGGQWRFASYDPTANSWALLAAPPIPDGTGSGAGLSWTWDGATGIYLLPGGGSGAVKRYRISSNLWEALPTPSVTFTISYGPALARVGSYLYVYGTPAAGGTTNLFRYGTIPPSDLRLTVDRTAFVAPDAATSPAWTNLSSATGTYRFQADIDAANVWVGPASPPWAWTPTRPAGSSSLTSAQAAFVSPVDGLYRVGSGSSLTVGYHQYVGTAHVYPTEAGCTACSDGAATWGETAFATIREAMASGAARVMVHPGRYPQTFYLVSGVEVVGSGAEATIIEAPAGSAATLVTAEGVAHATLARVTLAGAPGWQGFLAEGGAQGLTFARNIVRDLNTGLRLRDGSAVEVVNNTLVRNHNGYVAEGANPVNVRNTILAYNTGTAMQHGASPTSLSNTYNDFYANGVDMDPEDVGGGKLYNDPRFRDLAADDLRLAENSQLIDMGAPGDPTPPGAGDQVDIGYAEYNAAGFYVSPGYSETGLNDGLTWGVDAFSVIQDALDAAADTLRSLQGALPEGGYTVGVDEGAFAEQVTVPSHVRLVGSGADATTIDAGNAGSAVTFDAVTDAEVSGMTLEDASLAGAGVEVTNSSSGILVTRNVIRGNASDGVRLSDNSSAEVLFNTIITNTEAGVLVTGAGAWAEVRNNILDGNATGLEAASNGLIRNDYNLLHNTADVSGVTAGANSETGAPDFAATGYYYLTADSPALDAADPVVAAPLAGGTRADMGYKELTASPLTLFFGPEIDSTVTGNSGVNKVEVGAVRVTDASQPVTATLPSTWQTLTPATTGDPLYFWSQALTQATTGLYRVYSRATDEVGNTEEDESDWYEGAFIVDNTAPIISWGTPALPTSTSAAAVLAVAQASGTVDTGSGTRDDVEQVYFTVSGPGGAANYPATGGRAWIQLPATGSYTVRGVAVDEAGNQAQTSAVTVVVSGANHVATVSDPPMGSAVAETAVTLQGYVRFATGGSGQVSVAVSGGATVQATLDNPGATFSAWSSDITLPTGDGAKIVTITPSVGAAAGSVMTLSLTLDETAPTLAVSSPAAGTTVTDTVTYEGTASDGGSGLARVEVSVDGGYTWQTADLSSGDWSLNCDLTALQDSVSYPAQVRALDMAGNSTLVERPVTVDSLPPTDLAPVTFSEPEGQHLQKDVVLTISWNEPIDASGVADVLLAVDQNASTEPTAVVAGLSANATLNAIGDWYVHLATQDAAGNKVTYHYGPWHVRDMTNATFSARRQSIIIDGFIDLEHDEWLSGDLLGTDAQSLDTQQLYASWDGQAFYLGWSGAWWTLDGAMWAYLDVAPGGSMQSVDGAHTLPFAADLAVLVDSPEDGSLYAWSGSAWVLSTDPLAWDFTHGSSGDTEARIAYLLSVDQTVQLVAFALPREAGSGASSLAALSGAAHIATVEVQPWVIFPNTNPTGPDPTEPYTWNGLGGDEPNDGQPSARTINMSVTSPENGNTAWCPGSEIEYDILLENPEPTENSDLTLSLVATNGLGYETVEGASLTAGAVGSTSWTLTVPAIAAGASHHVTVTAWLADDLTGLEAVTTTIGLSSATPLTGSPVETLRHRLDGQAPTVSIDAADGSAIPAGSPTLTGAATDGAGSGVARVDVSLDGGATWHVAVGTLVWSATLDIPSGTTQVTLSAQAVDLCGHISPVVTRELYVDDTPPQVDFTAPAVITSTVSILSGSTFDPAPPDGALVQRVDMQVDSATSGWRATAGPYAPQDGSQGWAWIWNMPNDDGVLHTLRARAIDQAGNMGFAGWQATLVDVVAPHITLNTQLESVYLPNDPATNPPTGDRPRFVTDDGYKVHNYLPILRRGGALGGGSVGGQFATLILEGNVTDGSGVRSIRIWRSDPQGGSSAVSATMRLGKWQYAANTSSWAPGVYALRVEAVDIYGNSRVQGPYLFEVKDHPVAGLAASNDGPKLIGQIVTFTATITSGSGVAYTWDFDDGSTAEGRIVQHAYALPGDYSAKVTATNSASSMEAETLVTISDGIFVQCGPDRTLGEGETLSILATYADADAGSGYTASFDWGDGVQEAGAVHEAAKAISGSHKYADQGIYTVTVTVEAPDGDTAHDTLRATVVNLAPAVDASPASQTVQPSAAIAAIQFIATDVEADSMDAALSWRTNRDAFTPGSPSGLTLEANPCTVDAGIRTCAWQVAGNADMEEGTYLLRLSVTDEDGGMTDRDVTLTVQEQQEAATFVFDPQNPVAVKATTLGGVSGAFSLAVCASQPDVALDQLQMSLAPVATGATVVGVGSVQSGAPCVSFAFTQAPINVYSVQVTLAGAQPVAEDVLVVYDPYAGSTSGGGWFYWPGTEQDGYPGDRTSFGYNMTPSRNRVPTPRGLLLIRHLADGSMYQLKSTTLSGLTTGQNSSIPMGWASFGGTGAYLEPRGPLPPADRAFTVYVEDRNKPGQGTDRFWIGVTDGLALPLTPAANALPLLGGNIVVTHTSSWR